MNVLDLFSGIGGFSLGLERAGMRTVAFCECEPYAQAVLRKHWPKVPCYANIRDVSAARLAADGISADLVCGGFPCQDISLAGKGEGLTGARSGLWSEFFRLIEELRPRYAIIENVSALRARGLETILGQLASIGFDAQWHCIPAVAVGAPHQRDRVWIIAYSGGKQHEGESLAHAGASAAGFLETSVANTYGDARHERRSNHATQEQGGRNTHRGGECKDLSHTNRERLAERPQLDGSSLESRLEASLRDHVDRCRRTAGWLAEPDVGRVADGVPARVDRLRCLGNAIVPQIAEAIGNAIMLSR